MSSVTLPATSGAAAAARRTIAANAPLDPVRLAEAQLMVTEVVANAIRHAEGVTELTLAIDIDPARVRIGLAHEAPQPIDPDRPGLGFRLIERMARRWGTSWGEGQAEVWFEVRPAGTGAALAELTDEEVLARAPEDDVYRDEAVTRFASLASTLARRFRGKGVADADLDQVAMLGLLNAVARYDQERGAFEPFAVATIQGELKRHLRDKAWSVRVPRSLQERSLAVGKAMEGLAQTLGRAVTAEDVARELDIPTEEVIEAMAAHSAYRWESIDAPREETGSTLADNLRDEDDWASRSEDWQELADGIRGLPARERRILYLRFYQDLTQSEIAEQMGMSQMHVSRLLARALGQLKESVG